MIPRLFNENSFAAMLTVFMFLMIFMIKYQDNETAKEKRLDQNSFVKEIIKDYNDDIHNLSYIE